MSTPIPEQYHGVWARTLLHTPDTHDTTTWVRWLQTGLWHGDLRVPADVDRRTPQGRAQQQGFGGTTAITRPDPLMPEVCTWQRTVDFQPPRSTPDAGFMTFETPERVVETGVHGTYLEVWERLPGSVGQRIALAALDAAGQPTAERLLVSGQYLMHLRPRSATWPAGTAPDDTLADVVQRHPDQADALLDFEIALGAWREGVWTVERATLPALERHAHACTLQRTGPTDATVTCSHLPGRWRVLEWHAPG